MFPKPGLFGLSFSGEVSVATPFHVKHSLDHLVTACGLSLLDDMWERLLQYETWLAEEAAPAGGIGPHEVDRLRQRHIGDSLAFAAAFTEPPLTLIDIGSGVGLPGIPLAVVWEACEVVVMDRSRRRTELAERAIKVLGLSNVRVQHQALEQDTGRYSAIVTRAVFPLPEWVDRIGERLLPGGRAVTSLGSARPPQAPPGGEFETTVLRLPVEVLEHPVSLLIMNRHDGNSLGTAEKEPQGSPVDD